MVTCSYAGGGVASYIPGTEANRQSRAEHGQDPNRYSSGNQGYGNNTGGGGGGVMSYIPGTEANRQSRAEHGQDPNTYSSGNTGSNTGSGLMSYIPGTEANRVSRAEHGQDPNTYRSGSTNTGEPLYPCVLLCVRHAICTCFSADSVSTVPAVSWGMHMPRYAPGIWTVLLSWE